MIYWIRNTYNGITNFLSMLIMMIVGSAAFCCILIAAAPVVLIFGLLLIFGLRFNMEKLGDCMQASIAKAKSDKEGLEDD